MIDIESLRKLNSPEHIAITEHARQRLVERGIKVNDIVQCINAGKSLNSTKMINRFPAA